MTGTRAVDAFPPFFTETRIDEVWERACDRAFESLARTQDKINKRAIAKANLEENFRDE